MSSMFPGAPYDRGASILRIVEYDTGARRSISATILAWPPTTTREARRSTA
jgi:hypothetical protein